MMDSIVLFQCNIKSIIAIFFGIQHKILRQIILNATFHSNALSCVSNYSVYIINTKHRVLN